MKTLLALMLVLIITSCVSRQESLKEKRIRLYELESQKLEIQIQKLERCLNEAETMMKGDFERCSKLFEQKLMTPYELLKCQKDAEMLYEIRSKNCQ